MLVSHTVDQRLTVLTVIYHLQSDILSHHLLQSLGYLILITFILNGILHICIWL